MEKTKNLFARNPNRIKGSKSDVVYYAIIGVILALLTIIVVYPIYFIIIASISNPDAVLGGEVILWPIDITFSGYQKLAGESLIWTLDTFRKEANEKKGEPWDELEKSIIANIADDVIVGVEGKRVEIVVKKAF